MKFIINIIVLFLLSFNISNAQSTGDLIQHDDSLQTKINKELAIENGLDVLRLLFEGNDQKVNQNVQCREYFWCEFCESKIGCCSTFMETYKKYFSNEFLVILNASEMDVNFGMYEKDLLEYYELMGNDNFQKSTLDKHNKKNQMIKVQTMNFQYFFYNEDGEKLVYYFEFEKSEINNNKNWSLVSIRKYN